MSEERRLSEEDLEYLEELRFDGRFDEAEDFLLGLRPTRQVVDQLRKIAIARVLFAAQGADTPSVKAALDRFKQQLRSYQSQQDDYESPD
ncbi:MAG: hypothetical protein M1546_07090 [Chloroflexi bacterium]|nr:hypothetical protein [Chloroflexota bacterium]